MNILGLHFYQFVVAGIAILMIIQGVVKYVGGRANQSFLKLAIRILVWGGMAAVALFPNFTNILAEFIGLEGNINAVILIGFLLVFLMIFKILSVVERIEYDISRLTREEALKDFSRPKT